MIDGTMTKQRVDWVDYAKGICIILVVMMHSTLGVEKSIGTTGYLSGFVEWAKPFRMPDFFLISGLFLAKRISAPWRSYLDTKVLHFAYFYILWMTIQFALKGAGFAAEHGAVGALGQYALAFVEPFGTLWFIYLLAIFFVVTKALRHVPPVMVFVAAALLEMLPLHTGWLIIDEFAARYVYFFAGYWLAPIIFRHADTLWVRPALALMAMLYIWSTGHSFAVINGLSEMPGVGLVLGLAGASAVIATGILMARTGYAEWLRYLGASSIIIYLAFFLPMAVMRSLTLKFIPNAPVDVLSALTTLSGITGPLVFYWMIRKTPLAFLFKRPDWAKLKALETGGKHSYSASYDIPIKQSEAR
jgi:uncharacterized membrane protein YcfT